MRTDGRRILAVGIFGGKSELGNRIGILVRRGGVFSSRISAAGLASGAVVLIGLLTVAALTPRFVAFAQASPRPAFEVASVKSSGPDDPYRFRLSPAGRYLATSVSLRVLVANAYMVPEMRVLNGPGWTDSEKFNIEAKVGAELPPWPDSNREISLRLQSLLEDRFRLQIHREARDISVYNLVVSKGGPRLKTAPPDESAGYDMAAGRIRSMAVPLEYLTGILPTLLGRPVIDRTGLAGKFDYVLTFSPAGTDAADTGGPSIFTALQEQLGLKLESSRASIDFFVIDHAEKPDAN